MRTFLVDRGPLVRYLIAASLVLPQQGIPNDGKARVNLAIRKAEENKS